MAQFSFHFTESGYMISYTIESMRNVLHISFYINVYLSPVSRFLLASPASTLAFIHKYGTGSARCVCTMRDKSLPLEDASHSLKLIRCPTQAKGSSSVSTNVCLLPPSMRLDSRYTMSF